MREEERDEKRQQYTDGVRNMLRIMRDDYEKSGKHLEAKVRVLIGLTGCENIMMARPVIALDAIGAWLPDRKMMATVLVNTESFFAKVDDLRQQIENADPSDPNCNAFVLLPTDDNTPQQQN